MPNDFGPLADSTLVHDLMDDFTEDMGPLLGLAMNLGDEQSDGGIVREARPGQTITITDFAHPFTPYQPGAAGYVAPDFTAKDPVQVVLPNVPWAVSMALTAAEYRVLIGGPRQGVAYDALREKTNRMMLHGLKLKMATDFFALLTAGNYPTNFQSVAGTFSRATEIDIDAKLFSRKLMSRANATTILSPTAFGEWTKDHVAINTNTGQSQSERVMDGGVRSQVTSHTIHRTHVALPAGADRGVSFTKTAAVLVARVPDEPTFEGDPVSLKIVVDPATGLAFLFRVWKNPGTGTIQWDVAIIYKWATLQGEAAERITSAP